MANNFMANITENFDIENFAAEISQQYQAKGFRVQVLKMKNGCKIVFDQNCGGINMLLGMGQGITASCTIMGKERDTLTVNYSEGDWTGKIIGLLVGLLCCVPFVTSIIGICKQLSLPKDISSDMNMILGDMQ